MNKKFFTAAVAGVLTLCGFALSAADELPFFAKMDLDLKKNLTTIATKTNSEFGYKKNGSTEFVSLTDAMSAATTTEDGTTTVSLGNISRTGSVQFGFKNKESNAFEAAKVRVGVASDPSYSYSYNPATFFNLDFDKDFNGNIEIYVIGAPLPASTVTLLVGLGAAAMFLLYNDRKRRMRCSGQA